MFDTKAPNEEDSFGFQFEDLLAVGETISSAEISIEVVHGTDANPSAMIAGTATVNGTLVSIKLIGGIEGNIYCVHCLATTSAGLKKELKGDLKITAAC